MQDQAARRARASLSRAMASAASRVRRIGRMGLGSRMLDLSSFRRALVSSADQKCASFIDEVVDVVHGERYHGRPVFIELAARGIVREPLDGGVDAGANDIEIG